MLNLFRRGVVFGAAILCIASFAQAQEPPQAGEGLSAGGGLGNSGSGFSNRQPGPTSSDNPEPQAPGASQPGKPAAGLGNRGGGLAGPVRKLSDEEDAEETDTAETEDDPDAAAPSDDEALVEALSTTTDPVPADVIQGDLQKVSIPQADRNAGNLLYDVDIDVPAFRGLEPRIRLRYNSFRKTKLGGLYQGWLGYGWGLEGFDVIERASPGKGLPAYDPDDIYLLNGVELVKCADGVVTPSCATGGTHATEIESYRRIAFKAGPNEWEVTDRDGTVSTFRSPAAIAGATFSPGPELQVSARYRWHLTSVVDTHGNTVNYNYGCAEFVSSPLTAVCYPRSVTYNGAVITFHREARPDFILMANGHDISVTRQRIRTISVRVGGVLRSAYTLDYDQAPFSNASRLTRVERYGTNAEVATDGTVTPPTSGAGKRRIAAFTYQDAARSYVHKDMNITRPPAAGSAKWGRPGRVGDLDFDGRDELYGRTTVIHTVQPTPNDPDTRYSHSYHQSIVRFDQDGAVADTKHLDLGFGWTTNPGSSDIITRVPYAIEGRFHASRKTVDFLEGMITHKIPAEDHLSSSTVVIGRTISTSTALDMSLAGCTGIYAELCAVIPTVENPQPPAFPSFIYTLPFVADFEGDGVDKAYKISRELNKNRQQLGDFQGNGRQRALFLDGRKGELVDGAWQYSGAAIDLDCRYEFQGENGTKYPTTGVCLPM